MLFGGLIMPAKYAWIHAITYPLVYWHWTKNDGNCILTELEYKYKKSNKYKKTKQELNNIHQTNLKNTPGGLNDFPFMRNTFADFGINLSNRDIQKYVLPYLAIFSLISGIRFLLNVSMLNKFVHQIH
jgi:hypothetical protein